MYWKSDTNGSGYRIRQFDTPGVNQASMQRAALRELSEEKDPNLSENTRQRRTFLMMLPVWLLKKTKDDLEQMESSMDKTK